jgi:hypothetical protein
MKHKPKHIKGSYSTYMASWQSYTQILIPEQENTCSKHTNIHGENEKLQTIWEGK